MRATNKFIMFQELIDIARFQGNAFDASKYVEDVTSSDTIRTLMVNTSNRPVILHSRTVNFTGDGVVANIYREPVFDEELVDLTLDDIIRNPNDINPDTTNVQFYSDMTVTDMGTQTRATDYLFGNQTGSGGGAPGQLLPSPQIMKPGQIYLLDIAGKSSNSQDVAAKLEWIELDGIPGFEFADNGDFISYKGVSLI